MKYLITIGAAIALGIKWGSDYGWFVVAMIAVFIINILIDKDYERKKKEGN